MYLIGNKAVLYPLLFLFNIVITHGQYLGYGRVLTFAEQLALLMRVKWLVGALKQPSKLLSKLQAPTQLENAEAEG